MRFGVGSCGVQGPSWFGALVLIWRAFWQQIFEISAFFEPKLVASFESTIHVLGGCVGR